MEQSNTESITQLLRRWSAGEEDVVAQIFPLVYQELHRIAERVFRSERSDHTLQTTAIIHEAYLNLTKGNPVDWQNRAHFYGVMARVMRRILVDHARQRHTLKRGGGAEKIALEEVVAALDGGESPDVLALDVALKDLERLDPQKAAIVEARFFGGMTTEETAEMLEISVSTVVRQWRRAKAWLYRELAMMQEPGP